MIRLVWHGNCRDAQPGNDGPSYFQHILRREHLPLATTGFDSIRNPIVTMLCLRKRARSPERILKGGDTDGDTEKNRLPECKDRQIRYQVLRQTAQIHHVRPTGSATRRTLGHNRNGKPRGTTQKHARRPKKSGGCIGFVHATRERAVNVPKKKRNGGI